MITDWKNQQVAILGLGVEGLSTAAFLKDKGARLVILDRKPQEELPQEMTSQLEELGATFICGPEYLTSLSSFDIVIRSPGVPFSHEKIQEALLKGVIVTSHTKLFFDLCPCPIIGVTGTKGKGTTATLIFEMLKKADKDVHLGGNIGTPPLSFLDKLTKDSLVVLELSSFQLADLNTSPHVAVMLMVTSEHLDYHKDTAEYIDAKRNILRFQHPSDFAILNRDYPASNESDIHTDGQVLWVSREREVSEGCFVKDNAVWIRLRGPVAPSSHPTSSAIGLWALDRTPSGRATPSGDISEQKIIDIKDILLPGKHNLENVCAAVLSATLAGVGREDIVSVLKAFAGLEHRLQLVKTVKGVRYFDDSFSTTPETAIAAIEAFKEPEILILGGSSKGSDFTELGRVIREAENIKAIIGIGDEWLTIKEAIGEQKLGVAIEGATNMSQVVLAAARIAAPGDVVLLSPACASFGMFQNYKDRGNQFQNEVEKLSVAAS